MDDIRKPRLLAFADWAAANIRGDEKSEAHIFLDRLFQAFGQPGCLDVGGQPEFGIRKGKDGGGGAGRVRVCGLTLTPALSRQGRWESGYPGGAVGAEPGGGGPNRRGPAGDCPRRSGRLLRSNVAG